MKHDEIYRRYGIKTENKFRTPVFMSIGDFKIPDDTVLVYLPGYDLNMGPANSWSVVENTDRDLVVQHDKETPYRENAREVPFQFDKEIKDYHNRHRRFTRLRSLDTALRNKKTILIENTAMLRKSLRYQGSWYRKWREETNFLFNSFHNISKTMDVVQDRVFIIPITPPKRSYSKSEYDRITPNKSQDWLDLFDTTDALLNGYLYTFLTFAEKYLSDDEDDQSYKDEALFKASPWSLLSKENADRIWLSFTAGDSFSLISFKKLIEIVAERGILAFLSFCDSIIEQRNLVSGVNISEGEEVKFGADGTVLNGDSATSTIDDTDVTISPNADSTQVDLVERILKESKKGRISNREKTNLIKEVNKEILYPGTNTPMSEFAKMDKGYLDYIPAETRETHPLEFDTSYQDPSNVEMLKQYNQNVLDKDVARTIMSFQKAGVVIRDVRKESVIDAGGAIDKYEIDLKPTNGKASTFPFSFPKVKPNGRFNLNGSDVFYVAQRDDLPIRKIKPQTVKLTSYYGQLFITRGRLKSVDYGSWLFKHITELVEDGIVEGEFHNVSDPELKLPNYYGLLSTKYRSLKKGNIELFFDYHKREDHFSKEVIKENEKGSSIVVGKRGNDIITIGGDNLFYVSGKQGDSVLGELESILDISTAKRVFDAAEVKVFSKNIPLGLVLGQRIGLTNLLNALGVNYRFITTGDRKETVGDDEYTIKFSDKTVVLPISDRYAMLVMNSFNLIKNHVAELNVADMDGADAYFALLEKMGYGLRYFIEIDTMYDLFVDPMTEDLLVEMEEPTNLSGLFLRSAELLTTQYSPKEIDPEFMRDRGYERFPGMVYKAYVDAVRIQRSRPQTARAPITTDPKRVITDISVDATKNMTEISNPARNLREKSLISFSGEGGRSAQTMTPELRAYHPNELGHTSIDNTADSGKVGINATRSHKALFKSLRGTTKRFDKKENGAEALFTTTSLNFPGVDRDELKRLNFLSTQYDSVYPLKNYKAMPLHTPMEYQIPYMVDEEFAVTAKDNGKVLTVSEEGMTVLYDNGVEEGYTLGRVYGRVAGITVPHTLYTDLKPNDVIKKFDPVCWNIAYFKRDYLKPNRLAQKQALIIPTILQEMPLTFEDSSTMWEGLSEEFKVDLTLERDCHVPFGTQLADVVSIGDYVEENDSLFVMVPEHLQGYDDESSELVNSMKELNKDAPKSKYNGVVERIEVFYYGIKDDMHPSLKKLANASDKRRKKRVNELHQSFESPNGMVTSPINFGGNKIQPNTAVVRFFITKKDLPTVSGNKTVNAAQLKNTVSQQFTDTIDSVDSDEKAMAYFSYNGNNNRVVLSPMEQGLGNRALILGTQEGCKIYRGIKK